ncbi:MAG: type I restriction endonuclease [Candidatus Aminicenantes bacterium]|nr:type I restriction endonuclease [Candidatus Aminicenantes bacterium]
MKATTEKAFEAYIQETMAANGWIAGSNKSWDKQNALFPQYVTAFIKDTQPTLWAQMEKLLGPELPAKLIETLVKERNLKGPLHILRRGFKFYGKTFQLAFFKPAHGLVNETLDLYHKNTLHVTRQAACHLSDNSTVDMLLSMNGIPIATVELKNPASGQTWRHAVEQYKTHRDPRAPLFQFKKGAVVYFAVDPNEIYMTTRLDREKTIFLPFNRGSHPGEIDCGKGNPQHPSGHRTGYFWEEILQWDSFLDIVGSFVFLDKKNDMIFPRFHQLDAVRKLTHAARSEKTGSNYLIQHSAGSGKTKTISWLAHRLSSLHTTQDEKVFDCVIVITDRRVLDDQLQKAVYQIDRTRGVVKAIDQNSRQLAEALVDGTKIIVTTLQKFPFILHGLLHIAGAGDVDAPGEAALAKAGEWQEKIAARRYAIIVDEAHSSQTGELARELKGILGAGMEQGSEEAEPDWEDNLNKVMESRGKQKNLAFFAFTSTPKGKTLELFGRIGPSGKHEAFHTYSMKQAIQEGFILDVLQHYTTYKTYYKLVKAVEDDPLMPEKQAKKKLSRFMTLHPHNIEQKTEIIIEHFRRHVEQKLGGMAKAMVVTGSRLHAVRYMLSFQKYIAENKYTDIRPLAAFSGTVVDPDTGVEYTEPSMNIDIVTGKQISETQLPGKFASPDYQVLLVADKYQTGYDQPLLCAMYVDKRLDGVQAVQTLSRLNRTYAGKEPPFILDFVNDTEDIYTAFKPYYHATTLQEPSDPYHLEELAHELDGMHVYEWSEVAAFCRVYYTPAHKQNPSDHGRMEKHIQPSVDRFKALDEQDKTAFYDKMTAYVRFYSFISQVIPYTDKTHEMLYGFGRYLIRHLQIGDDWVNPHPENDVTLFYYRVEKESTVSMVMEGGEPYGVKSPTAVGTGEAKEEDKPLSEIIRTLNERFGTDFSEEDRLFFQQIKEKACKDDRIIQTAKANTLDKFELGIRQFIQKFMMQRIVENDGIVTRYMDDTEFQKVIFQILAKEIYRGVRANKE